MALELRVDFNVVDGAPALRDGWRGLLDFGERWTEDDSQLWPAGSGAVPVGEPLVYGCELRLSAPLTDDPVAKGQGVLHVWSLDTPRPVMRKGVEIEPRDGNKLRASGTLL